MPAYMMVQKHPQKVWQCAVTENAAKHSATVNPYVLETIKTYCFGNEMEIEVIPEKDGLTDIEYLKEHVDAQTACVLIQHPNYYGNLEEAAEIGEITHGAGAKYVMNVNPIFSRCSKDTGRIWS